MKIPLAILSELLMRAAMYAEGTTEDQEWLEQELMNICECSDNPDENITDESGESASLNRVDGCVSADPEELKALCEMLLKLKGIQEAESKVVKSDGDIASTEQKHKKVRQTEDRIHAVIAYRLLQLVVILLDWIRGLCGDISDILKRWLERKRE